MFVERGPDFTREAVRDWETRLEPMMTQQQMGSCLVSDPTPPDAGLSEAPTHPDARSPPRR
jgi:hypothetical protein